MLIFGIDPGASGGIASLDGQTIRTAKFSDREAVMDILRSVGDRMAVTAIEDVHAFPKDAKGAIFAFGTNYGWWLGALDTIGIPFRKVAPLKWQRALGIDRKGMSKADGKRLLRQLAAELFPSQKITCATADALLIAEWLRREFNPNNGQAAGTK